MKMLPDGTRDRVVRLSSYEFVSEFKFTAYFAEIAIRAKVREGLYGFTRRELNRFIQTNFCQTPT
jgi:hypothetical protein